MPALNSPKKVALVHDWLTGMRGGEKVLEVLCELYPDADLFTLVHVKGKVSSIIEARKIVTSPLQYIPGIRAFYRHLLPLMPWAMEQFDFSGYDLIISTSHCVAKAAKPRAGAKHVCYCHTPMRYIWDQYDSYFGKDRASWAVRTLMAAVRPSLQRYDLQTLPRVDQFLANSKNVQERIDRIYRRESAVFYPPADVAFYGQPTDLKRSDAAPFYLIVSALAPYKRVDIAVEAFRTLGKRLIVVGEGQENRRLRQLGGDRVEFRGWLKNDELRALYQTCQALIFPGEEDFGIVPVEAMAAGCPVIAFEKGGALETVVNHVTGLFFKSPTAESLAEAVIAFEAARFDSQIIARHAELFSRDRCKKALQSVFIEYPG